MRWIIAVGLLSLPGCSRPQCTPASYRQPECRVIAENELAQLKSSDGIEVRFQDAGTERVDSWEAKGLVQLAADGTFHTRVAGLGDFRISIHRGTDGPTTATLAIDNVHPEIPALTGEVERVGLLRKLEVPLTDEITQIRGELPDSLCDGPYRIAAVADIQTNPLQFARIVEEFHNEAAGETRLLGVLLIGDIAELGTRDEMEHVAQLMAASPVPLALTAGNHDIYANFDAVYNQTFGPGNHVFDICDTHVVLLDTGSGYLAESVRGRLNELMETDREFLVTAVHHPPFPGHSSSGWTKEDQAQHLVAELAAQGGDLLLAGHRHLRDQATNTIVPQITVGTGGATQYAVDPDYGFLRMTFADKKLDSCFVSVPAPGSPGIEPPKRGPESCRGS